MKEGDKLGDWIVCEVQPKYRIVFQYTGEEVTHNLVEWERRQVWISQCKNKEQVLQKCIQGLQHIERDIGYKYGKSEIQEKFVTLLGIKTDFVGV